MKKWNTSITSSKIEVLNNQKESLESELLVLKAIKEAYEVLKLWDDQLRSNLNAERDKKNAKYVHPFDVILSKRDLTEEEYNHHMEALEFVKESITLNYPIAQKIAELAVYHPHYDVQIADAMNESMPSYILDLLCDEIMKKKKNSSIMVMFFLLENSSVSEKTLRKCLQWGNIWWKKLL